MKTFQLRRDEAEALLEACKECADWAAAHCLEGEQAALLQGSLRKARAAIAAAELRIDRPRLRQDTALRGD